MIYTSLINWYIYSLCIDLIRYYFVNDNAFRNVCSAHILAAYFTSSTKRKTQSTWSLFLFFSAKINENLWFIIIKWKSSLETNYKKSTQKKTCHLENNLDRIPYFSFCNFRKKKCSVNTREHIWRVNWFSNTFSRSVWSSIVEDLALENYLHFWSAQKNM